MIKISSDIHVLYFHFIKGLNGLRVSGQGPRSARCSPTYERLLYDVIPIASTNWRERSYSDYSDYASHVSASSMSDVHPWTPSRRKRWRELMQQIDNNSNGLRIALSNCWLLLDLQQICFLFCSDSALSHDNIVDVDVDLSYLKCIST